MAMSDRSEQAMTELVEQVGQRVIGEDQWAQATLFERYKFKEWLLPVITALTEVIDAEPRKAKRGDEVEAWIKRARDQYTEDPEAEGPWDSLDALLDDYRLHADVAAPLSEEVADGGHRTE